jgi:hypothetical protein
MSSRDGGVRLATVAALLAPNTSFTICGMCGRSGNVAEVSHCRREKGFLGLRSIEAQPIVLWV